MAQTKRKMLLQRVFFELIWNTLEDFTLRILLVSAVVSVIANMIVEAEHRGIAWIEGFAIFMAVLISSTVTAANDYQKEKQFRKLSEIASSKKELSVWRDGKLQTIHESELVTGDIVKVVEGMEVSADMMLLQGFEITIDESTLTGEPDPIRKKIYKECLEKRNFVIAEGRQNWKKHSDIYSPILMSGTKVLTGEGKAIVLVVGDASCVGKIRSLVQQEGESTPLQDKLEIIAKDIGKFGLVSAIITLTILFGRFMLDRIMTNTLHDLSQYLILIEYVIIAITVIVVAIPEGLPLAVTLSLAYSVRKMLKDRNLVRRLEATETMGGANNICSDKTGTLTQNKMSLTSIWNGEMISIDNYANNSFDGLFPQNCHELLRQALACNSSATLSPNHGSKTEIALLEFLRLCNEDYQAIRNKFLNENTIKYPFSSQRQRMSTILENGYPPQRRIHLKGASEIVLASCTKFYDLKQGRIIDMTPSLRQMIEEQIEVMADQALRTIGLAYKEVQENEDLMTKNEHNVFTVEESDFILLGVLGIKDILRKEVKKAVENCKLAGIKVRMVTGDNKITAKAIAKECGIIDSEESLVMTGPEFIERVGGVICKECRTKECDCPRDKSQAEKEGREVRVDTIANGEEFDRIYPKLDVLARSRPEDKYALVVGLIERGGVVAVTGDGTNDAPALKRADVGFAMNTGTDVAKEAADIILVDDNFASIVDAVRWGRNIYENIRKFLQFQLTVNIVAVGITLISAAILKEAVLSAVQLLWVNLIMDTLASLALATEPPSDELLKRKPHDRNEYMLSNKMKKHILGQAFYQLFVMILLIFTADKWVPESLPKEMIPGFHDELKYYSKTGYIRSGRAYLLPSGQEDYKRFANELGPSRHYTLVFNTFVFLQVFNFLNCRKIQDEINVFRGVLRNPFFVMIVSSIAILQLVLGNYGGLPLSVSSYGLDFTQWMIALSLASGCLFWSVFLKLIPIAKTSQKNTISDLKTLDISDGGVCETEKDNKRLLENQNTSPDDFEKGRVYQQIISQQRVEKEISLIPVLSH